MKISKEAKIGIATIISIFLLVWGFNFLKGKNIFKPTNVFYIVYDDLGGLKESNYVLINGFKVGQVSSLSLQDGKDRKVTVRILVDKKYKIPKGTIAKLKSTDFMGTKAIELNLANSEQIHESGDTLIPKVGKGILDKVEDLEGNITNIIVGLDSILASFNAVFTEDVEGNLRNTFSNLNSVTENVSDFTADDGELMVLVAKIDMVIKKMNSAMTKLPETMDNLNAVSDSLKEAELKLLINNTAQAIDNLNLILDKVEKGEGSAGQFVNNDSLYLNLTNTSKELELLLNDLRNNPKRYVHFSLFGKNNN